MTKSYSIGLVVIMALGASACGPAKAKTEAPETPQEEPAASTPSAAPAAEEPKPEGEAKPAAKKWTKAELETEMAPPEKLIDLRPILGTDPDVALPAIFAKVRKGMTAKELDAEFPGVGAVTVEFVNFTKQGKKWVRVKGNQAHKELLDLQYDDKGGLVKIGYMFDPATASPALWDYLKKAAVLRFGETDVSRDLITFPVKDVKELHIHKSDDKSIAIQITF